MKLTEDTTENNDESAASPIAHSAAFALIMTSLIAVGYLVGYLHATSMPANAEPGFMLGFVAASAFAVPAIYVLNNGVPGWLDKLITWSAEGSR